MESAGGDDNYADLASIIPAVLDHSEFPDGPVERLEINCHATGEVTYRVWAPRAEEATGGYLNADQASSFQR